MAEQKDLISRIIKFNRERDPGFLDLKYKAMRENNYRFFRATAHIFYEDIPKSSFLFKAPPVWLCGDLHLENFGSYKGDNRVAYFNINDFDECILGSLLLDLARFMVSVYIAAGDLGIAVEKVHALNDVFIDTYFRNLEKGYIRVLEKETTTGVIKRFLEEVKNRRRKTFIKEKTSFKKRNIRLKIDNVHTCAINKKEKEAVMKAIRKWAAGTKDPDFYKVKDIVFRIAGTSSLGLKRYIVLVEGNGTPGENYLLDVKEAWPSCLNAVIMVRQPKWASEPQRVIEVQKRFISDPPALLQDININGKAFVLKELQPLADRVNYQLFADDIKKLESILSNMACIYAWSNLRASGRQGSAIADELISFAGNASVKKKLKKYAHDYSKKMKSYYKEYCLAFDKGLLNLNTHEWKYFQKK
jgi:uncharacterized protein (DUF2252 family)